MPYFASADWYVEMGALNVHDIAALRRVREHRNFVAHHIPDIVMSSGVEVEPERLADIINLVAKLDRWWLRYVEVSCNPEFDGKEFSEKDFDEAFSMRMYNLHLLISFVSGDERPLREMHTTFKDVWPIQEE